MFSLLRFPLFLSQLPEQQSGEIQGYLDYLFNRSAQLEELYYRSGFLDGIKLYQYLQQRIGNL